MAVSMPTPDQLRRAADELGLDLSDRDVDSYIELMAPSIEAYNVVDGLSDDMPEVKYPRAGGFRPEPADNPYNAWYQRTEIKGAPEGKLKGKRVAIKDNVMVAGVPMMNGASTLEGYVPEVDATVVTRILEAGGEIAGKAHCEYFCFSGGSHTNAAGPVHNPRRMGYSAGGSSSGSAALVAAGEVDMAIGGDQGGSIRMPASFCGVYGLKPTHGLVPYTGIIPIEPFVDHTGPITATVRDNALLLEVIAGPDGYDPRQGGVLTDDYTGALGGGVEGLKIAVVSEGFGLDNSEPEVDAKVRAAAARLAELGARVEEVSIPWHALGGAIWLPICGLGSAMVLTSGDGFGYGRSDLYVTSFMDHFRESRSRANEYSETVKLFLLCGLHVQESSGAHLYGKAINLARRLRAAYDAVLEDHDLLLMPTTPMTATPLPGPGAGRAEVIERAIEMMANTAQFDVSHHPAMALPCGLSGGLPVSMMLVGRHFDEPAIYRAAHAFEQSGDWTGM